MLPSIRLGPSPTGTPTPTPVPMPTPRPIEAPPTPTPIVGPGPVTTGAFSMLCARTALPSLLTIQMSSRRRWSVSISIRRRSASI
ncbi:MAG: hypothetical protein DME02_08045 [Candidatus Rokuibacteriota bacterium]|nr:MAG: hypothetical protein DME02_08045 [Candidatus Rokubacteria bacterium]PYO22019.1 MAG: hypothetical protein DMD85_12580 [Candidatus Rokubacteria bacterium]